MAISYLQTFGSTLFGGYNKWFQLRGLIFGKNFNITAAHAQHEHLQHCKCIFRVGVDIRTYVCTYGCMYLDYRSIVATVWKDKCIIHFLITIHMAKCSLPITAKRREKDGTQKDVECPPCLPDYQKFMRGIDRGDQMMRYYNAGR